MQKPPRGLGTLQVQEEDRQTKRLPQFLARCLTINEGKCLSTRLWTHGISSVVHCRLRPLARSLCSFLSRAPRMDTWTALGWFLRLTTRPWPLDVRMYRIIWSTESVQYSGSRFIAPPYLRRRNKQPSMLWRARCSSTPSFQTANVEFIAADLKYGGGCSEKVNLLSRTNFRLKTDPIVVEGEGVCPMRRVSWVVLIGLS